MNNFPRKASGFTLIELMITLAIVAILASVSIFSYSRYTQRNHRVGIQAFMMAIAGKQQQYMLDARSYASVVTALSVTQPSQLTSKYTVTIAVDNSATPPTYTITAVPIGTQVKDTSCGTLTLTSTGAKTASGTSGVSGCW